MLLFAMQDLKSEPDLLVEIITRGASSQNGRHVGRFGDGAWGIRVVGKMNESSGVGGATVEY